MYLKFAPNIRSYKNIQPGGGGGGGDGRIANSDAMLEIILAPACLAYQLLFCYYYYYYSAVVESTLVA